MSKHNLKKRNTIAFNVRKFLHFETISNSGCFILWYTVLTSQYQLKIFKQQVGT